MKKSTRTWALAAAFSVVSVGAQAQGATAGQPAKRKRQPNVVVVPPEGGAPSKRDAETSGEGLQESPAESAEPDESDESTGSAGSALSAKGSAATTNPAVENEVEDEGPPQKVGCALESNEGRIVLSKEPGKRAVAGSRVAFHDARGDEAVVGKVERVNNTTYWAKIAMNESVRVGECAYATKSEASGSLFAPQPGAYKWAVAASVKPWLGLNGDTSGFLFEGFGDVRLSERLRLRVAVEPIAPPIGSSREQRRTPGAFEAYAALSATFHLMEVGFGVGAGTANIRPNLDPTVGLLLTPLLRIGAEDGFLVRLRSSAVVADIPVFGSFRGELEIPVAYGVKILHAGGGGESGYYFAEVGIKKLMTGNGGPGTWLSRVSLGHGGTLERKGPIESPSRHAMADGPYMGLGVERRF